MRELSPAARALVAAMTQHTYGSDPEDLPNEAARFAALAAAALRALTDEVLPERTTPRDALERTLYHEGRLDAAIRFRAEILAIATELDGGSPTP